jgi:hypothetical protein
MKLVILNVLEKDQEAAEFGPFSQRASLSNKGFLRNVTAICSVRHTGEKASQRSHESSFRP